MDRSTKASLSTYNTWIQLRSAKRDETWEKRTSWSPKRKEKIALRKERSMQRKRANFKKKSFFCGGEERKGAIELIIRTQKKYIYKKQKKNEEKYKVEKEGTNQKNSG